jgi:hypothetical protein
MVGVYQHCSERHLHRYLAEFDLRYSDRIKFGVDDTERARRAIKGVVGKRAPIERLIEKPEKPEPPKPLWPDGLPYVEPIQLPLPFIGLSVPSAQHMVCFR